MTNNFLNIFYISAIIISAVIFIRYIIKDAKKYLGGQNNLSKIHNSIINTLSYINKNMLDNGRFIYIRNLKNSYSTKNPKIYDTTTHVRILYYLRLCEKKLNIKDLAERRKTSAKYFVDNYIKEIGNGKFATISDSQEENIKTLKAKLSSTAMALVTFADLKTENFISDKILEGMGQFLLFMQLESGQFYNYYDLKTGKPDIENLNFTGDAPLGLLYLYEFNPKEQWLNSAKKGLLFLAEKRKNCKNIEFDYNAMLATEKLFQIENNGLTDNEKTLLTSHLIKMAEHVLSDKLKLCNNTFSDISPLNIFCIIEGLIATYNCIDDENLKERIMKVLDAGMKFLRLVQIQRGPLKGGFPNSADWRELGVPKTASFVKMDTVQHALAACVKFQNMFTD